MARQPPELVEKRMSGTPPVEAGNGAPVKRKRSRSPSVPRPAFIIVQLMGEDGAPMEFDKRRVKVVSVERQAEKVLEAVESGTHAHAFYLRVVVPPGAQRTKAAPAAE